MGQHSRHSSAGARGGRSSRRRSRFRRRRRLVFAAGLSLAVALTTAVLISLAGVDLANATVERAKSLVELMNQRSPGQRTEARLTKIKHRHFRVLAKRVSPAIPSPVILEAVDSLFAPQAVSLLPIDIEVPTVLAQLTPPPLSFPPAIFVPRQPQPPGVPEPGTWSTIILGFGLGGWFLRRKRAGRRQIPAA